MRRNVWKQALLESPRFAYSSRMTSTRLSKRCVKTAKFDCLLIALPAIVPDQPVQKGRNNGKDDGAKNRGFPGMDLKPWRNVRRQFEHGRVDHNQEQPKGNNGQWKRENFQDRTKRGIHQPYDKRGDQRINEPVHYKTGNKVRHNQE